MSEYKDFSLKGFKSLQTHDGAAFSASLCYKGRKIGTVENSGTGGPTIMFVWDAKDKAIVNEYCQSDEAKAIQEESNAEFKARFGIEPKYGSEFDWETLADMLVEDEELKKNVKKLVKKHGVIWMFPKNKDQLHHYRYPKGHKWTAENFKALLDEVKKNNPEAVILNEKFGVYP